MSPRLPLAGALLLLLVACGQKGALYLPDKNATVVTSAPAATASPPPAPSPAQKKPGDDDQDPPPPK